MADSMASRVEAVRAFNRFWTARIGVLDATHLGTEFSLAEARVLFELAHADAAEVAALRKKLALDAGYLSRMLASFRKRKLVVVETSESDARRRVARLTAKGRAAQATLDRRAREHVRTLLAPLDDEEQSRAVGALGAVQRLLDARGSRAPAYLLRPPRAGDLGWIVERHGALYAREYGWDERFEALCAKIVADYALARAARAACWIAEVDGERAGCVLCVKKDAKTAQLRLLLVEPRFRGLGIGGRLVDECIRFARASGYKKMVLWTNDVLVAALRLYERAGFSLVASNEHADFGPKLTAQTWERSLVDPSLRSG